ncbi:ATP-binding cassette superfamily, partial [Micromonas commoda]
MVPMLKLFRFYEPADRAMLGVGILFCMIGGVAFPCINIAFGELLDSTASMSNIEETTKNAVMFMVGVALVLGVSLAAGFGLVGWAAARGASNVRRAYLKSMMAQDVAFFDAAKAGELSAATSEKVQILQNGTAKKMGELVQSTFTGVGGLAVGFYFSWELSLVIMAGVPMLAGALYFLVKATTKLTAANPEYEKAGAIATESLTACRVTSALNAQGRVAERYESHLGDAERVATKNLWNISFANGGLFGVMFIMYAAGLWFGAYLISDSTNGAMSNSPCMTGGTVIMVFFAVLIGGFSFGMAGSSIEAVIKARTAAHQLYEVIDRKPKGGDGADARTPTGLALKTPVSGDIMFNAVYFSYTTRPVFRGIDLHIPAGMTVALVGESGCGKSTVTRLLERFYDPSAGTITLDGVDITKLRINELRSAIGVVSQEPLLFNASIRMNIAVGRAGVKHATDVPIAEIESAARAASAHDFIATFPDGYDTVVGGKNSKLSGGQKQRVAIARAALRNPPILILDEATSALDTENERLVQAALDELVAGAHGRRTTIVIAHRLTTVRGADKIVVLGSRDAAGGLAGGGAAEGSVVLEEGTHDKLMEIPGGRYRGLVGIGGSRGTPSASSVSLAGMDRSASQVDLKAKEEEEEEEDKVKDSKDAKGAQKKGPKVKAARIWAYSEPEYPVLAFGGFIALANGCVFPSIAFVFAEMLALFYSHDTDYIMDTAYMLGGIFFAIAVISWCLTGIQGGVFAVIGEKLTTRLRVHLFRAILRQDVAFFDDPDNSVGALTSNLRTDTSTVRAATGQGLGSALQTFGSLCFGLAVAMEASWKYGLVLLAAVPILSIGEMINMQNIATGEAVVSESLSRTAGHISETATMIREVKAFGMEGRMYDIYDSMLKAPHKEERNKALTVALAFGLAQSLTMLFYAFAFWWGAELIAKGELDFYDFMKSLWALGFCAAGAGQAAAFAGDATAAGSAAARIFSLIDRVPPIDTRPGQGLIIPPEQFKGRIEFKGVKFSYPQREAAVLGGLDLVAAPGETIALIGQSGSGKSTAVQLIERFYDPCAGSITLDGVDIRDLDPMWLRQQIGIVEQEPTLFSGTVHDNIAAGKCGEPATRDEVIEAAKISNAHEFVSKMPNGYDSEVGVGGGLVSGGQKQRIAIARAIIGRPRILLLDEATSALDNESERLVQASVDNLLNEENADKRTTFVIAHRLSTIRNATRICILENADGEGAKLVEQGTHDELMKIGGRYTAL